MMEKNETITVVLIMIAIALVSLVMGASFQSKMPTGLFGFKPNIIIEQRQPLLCGPQANPTNLYDTNINTLVIVDKNS